MSIEYMKYFDELPKEQQQAIDKIVENLWRESRWNERLRKELVEAKDEAYKDKELQEMEEKYLEMRADYYRGFPISEEEEKSIDNWIDEHEKKCKGGHGAVGGKYTYHFIPTSIGVIGTIKCSCGKEFDFQGI